MVYFVDPEGIVGDERIRLLKSNRDWNVDDLLMVLGWDNRRLSANFGWD